MGTFSSLAVTSPVDRNYYSATLILMTCHSEERSKPVLSKAEGNNLVLGKQAFFYANNEILRLRGVYPERSEGLRLRMTDISFLLW
jgi:hypothetical protein